MHRLVHTRSQHFVNSPRRTASPLKHKHAITNSRHPIKRRRIGSTAFAPSRAANTSDNEDTEEEEPLEVARSRRLLSVLTSEAGLETANRSRSRRRDGRPNGKGEIQVEGRVIFDVFDSSDEESSPKKRKRSERVSDSGGESGSWVEMEEDEEEPEFIAESDQHLLAEAPAYALHRLRKAELIRLWKVAGMWTTGDEDEVDSIASTADEDDDGGLGKKELVDGLVAARIRKISPLPSSPHDSPRRKALEAAFEIRRLRSSASANAISPTSSSSSSNEHHRSHLDTDATPHAGPRTRSRLQWQTTGASLSRHKQRAAMTDREKDQARGRNLLLLARNKSLGGEKGDRKARFGEEVKSPANGLIARRPRRSSTLSSAYTTTDNSPPEDPSPPRQTPRRLRRTARPRGYTPSLRLQHTAGTDGRTADNRSPVVAAEEAEEVEEDNSESEQDEIEPTPLAQRLRPRTKATFVNERSSELEADAEDDDEESLASPGPSSRLRSRDQRIDSDVSMNLELSKPLPDPGAKRRAIEAMQGGESDEEVMDVDDDAIQEEEIEEDEVPRSGPLTRSQIRAQGASLEADPRRTRQRVSVNLSDSGSDEVAASESGDTSSPTSVPPESDGPEMIDQEADEQERTTRSGKAFGVMQSRKSRLRQEAIDDPDMEVEDEEEDDDEADEDSFEADVDLTDATVSTLTRLLRDELVQLCEAGGLEVGGTKPQLAKALLELKRDEQKTSDERSTTSSGATARPSTSRPRKVIHAIGSNVHVPGKVTPVLLRDHYHATDPATPPLSDESNQANGEAELNLDLAELGLEDSMIKPEHLVKLEKIGSGGFKDVYVGKLRGRKVAISEFRGHLSEMDIRELKLLAEFSHPNIVRFRGICIPEDTSQIPCMLVSELCENGDLFDYIRNVPAPTLKRVLCLMLDIARGIEYLHTRKPSIIHRDCKSSNILINRQGQAKVGDFGLARVKTSTRSMIRSLVGTVNWQAPELWHPHPRYDYKVDVFSAAMVFWEMLSGWTGDKKYPWEGYNEHYIYDAVGIKERRPSIAGLRKYWGIEPVNLMERMWHRDPGERPTMTDVVTDLETLVAECA